MKKHMSHSVVNEQKRLLILRQSEFISIPSYQRARSVAIVESQWFSNFLVWLRIPHYKYPEPIPNDKLLTNGKLDPTLRNLVDFTAVEIPFWDTIAELFKGGPKIIRPIVLNQDGHPEVITDPFPIQVEVDGIILRKTVSPSWSLGSLKQFLCENLSIPAYSRFKIRSAALSDDLTIAEAYAGADESAVLSLEITSEFGRGITNRSNNSFLNSILQCIFKVKGISDIYLSSSMSECLQKLHSNQADFAVSRNFAHVISELNTDSSSSVDCSCLYDIITEKHFEIVKDRQNDACMALESLISDLHKESVDQAAPEDESAISCLLECWINKSERCQFCDETVVKKERRFVLSLPIPKCPTKVLSIFDCLEEMKRPRRDESAEMTCQNCYRESEPLVSREIDSLGETLIIHLDRFGDGGILQKKNQVYIEYPNCFAAELLTNKLSGDYCLEGVIFHDGDFFDGFYTAGIIHNGKWVLFHDETASSIEDEENIHTQSAYMLFYTLRSRRRS